MIQLVTHGGKCCGIKTIYGFPHPNHLVDPIGADEKNKNRDVFMPSDHVGKSFYPLARPEETAEARFDAFILYVKRTRPSHLIEAILNQFQLPYWKDFLKSRGFHLVQLHHNSNTSGTGIYTFHKIIRKGKDVSPEDARKQLAEAIEEVEKRT